MALFVHITDCIMLIVFLLLKLTHYFSVDDIRDVVFWGAGRGAWQGWPPPSQSGCVHLYTIFIAVYVVICFVQAEDTVTCIMLRQRLYIYCSIVPLPLIHHFINDIHSSFMAFFLIWAKFEVF